ncbi:MAG TPA: DUF6658 family protein [Coleofasciculaceae cyanobacterium]
MINQFFNRFASFVSKFQLKQVLAIVFASFFLLVSTACSAQPDKLSSVRGADNRQSVQRPNNPVGQKTGLREFTDRQDGKDRPDLSSYVDNDSRQNAATSAKTKELVDRARENSTRVIENPKDFADNYRKGAPLNQRVDNISQDVGKAVQDLKEGAAEGAQKNTRQLKSNVDRAGDNIKQAAENTKQNVKSTGQDIVDSTKRAID